ncbi:60S ribosomal protein L7A [Bonamia ostreae]|uniref:60S ribosomal protein L7a n=1 Tax=Bonamia ostreae TaxID=126728 RepID=A0ABV2ALM2_9EUKA
MVLVKIDDAYKNRYRDVKLDHLFKARPKKFNHARQAPKKDFSRVVKWPKYIVIQRKKAILKKRLKIPPPVNQFSFTLNSNLTKSLYSLLKKYRPESTHEKKLRLKEAALQKIEDKTEKALKPSDKPYFVKYGLRHVTTLVEKKKAKLVVIAGDVDPLEMILFLPTLCRKMDVPYCIVRSKSMLGSFVHQKKVTCLAFTDVRKGKDEAVFEQLVKSVRANFNEVEFKKWGGGEMGKKSRAKVLKEKKFGETTK